MYEARTHGSVRGMMLDLIIQHHPTRFEERHPVVFLTPDYVVSAKFYNSLIVCLLWVDEDINLPGEKETPS